MLIIDNAISNSKLSAADAAWPEASWNGWHRYHGKTADKFGLIHHSLAPPAIQRALWAVAEVIEQRLPDGCFVDYEMHGAGMHMIPPGGFLGRHLDAEKHPQRPWSRTHSAVLFLDSSAPADGGKLVIDGNSVDPIRNQLVIFETPGAWHEVTQVTGYRLRRSLALFAWRVNTSASGATSARFEVNHEMDSCCHCSGLAPQPFSERTFS